MNETVAHCFHYNSSRHYKAQLTDINSPNLGSAVRELTDLETAISVIVFCRNLEHIRPTSFSQSS